ncbi:hypothetical protein XENTR_v10019457 [Xenopus tropicalis]|uniref:E3 ubiquitin-protein ligase rnf146 n=1 Tax=Xenopus tropicalis TaxID=8364 RepID=A0A5S6LNM1_XENTR|nr:fish-egg lectin [Xenopus tropicalis]KAE8594142.1 hypothetical protein XENTR_v10019457 [Xenopus tropicalis]|eukprot:XP_002934679.1 PREDICTED: fish-egg lectin-like [Xenopus tropicalis]
MLRFICLSLLGAIVSAGHSCTPFLASLVQLDAGDGMVLGVSESGHVFNWTGNDFLLVPGQQLAHVTVGPAGIWGVGKDNVVYKLLGNQWKTITGGTLKQADAGGNTFLSGVNTKNNAVCLNWGFTTSKYTAVSFSTMDGSFIYYSCGLLGCWALSSDSNNNVFYRQNVDEMDCQGNSWIQVNGNMTMTKIEAGTDGSVFGVDSGGNLYRRLGISRNNPTGTRWHPLNYPLYISHATYDSGTLWCLTPNGVVFRCQVSGSGLV